MLTADGAWIKGAALTEHQPKQRKILWFHFWISALPKNAPDRVSKRLSALANAKPVEAGAMAKSMRKKTRGADRKTTYRFGRVLNGNREEHPCILRDLSASGARLVFEGEPALTQTVTLHIELTGERRRARVIWQKEREAGLSFEDA